MDTEPNRLIIENRSSVNWYTALSCCQSVIDEGRISESPNGPMYCAATTFRAGGKDLVVWADRNKASDRLVVCDHKGPA